MYLIPWMFICGLGFYAALLQQSSGRERKIFEKSKKIKIYSQANVYI